MTGTSAPRTLPKITTSLPHSDSEPSALTSPHPSIDSPSALSTSFNIPSLLLSSALPSGSVQSDPRHGAENGVKLLSTRNPLSIPITTANFRRFVAKVGPVFWLQDRIEEILLWKRGWKVTAVWMSVYAFLCYFPKLILLLPNVLLVSVLLATYPSSNDPPDPKKSSPPAPPGEGSVDWQANLQAIQNLMGAYSDLYDAILPLLPHLVHQSPHSSTLLLVSAITLAASIPLVTLVPLQPVFLVLGLATFGLTHPLVLNILIPALTIRARELASRKHLRQRALRAIDDDRLQDKHWRSELREVELFENERWAPGSTAPVGIGPTAVGEDGTITSFMEPSVILGGAWAKANLRPGERLAWTRGRDGWSGVPEEGGGPVSSLTFSLDPGWAFVETEDWRPDLETVWAECGGDANGWVYSNDVWMDGQPVPREAWINKGITRRRRWTRRVYWSPPVTGVPMS